MTELQEKRRVDFQTYRGKCKEMAEQLIRDDPQLRLVRGFYHCPFWGRQQHWWTEKADGTIVDPTVSQFPSNGAGRYEEFTGTVHCEHCGKEAEEKSAYVQHGHVFCGGECFGFFVGLGKYIKKRGRL